MRNEKLQEFISGGENLTVEFKRSKNKLNKDVFETVCAFLNRICICNDKVNICCANEEKFCYLLIKFGLSSCTMVPVHL